MSTNAESVLQAALALSEVDQFEIATCLLDKLPAGVEFLEIDDPGLEAELERRPADDEGSLSWNELKAER